MNAAVPIVLFGGRSDERHVSVASAQHVVRHLDSPAGWFWAPDGTVHHVTIESLLRHENPFVADYVPTGSRTSPDLDRALDGRSADDCICVLALHGGEGEDGTVQRQLETRGIAFTGSGPDASARAFNKERAKELVRDRVRVPESRWTEGDLPSVAGEMLERYERVVAKPVAGGSSRGLLFLSRGDAIPDVSVPYLVERFIAGRELTVGVVEDEALPVLEIEVAAGFQFDYAGKYLGKGTREICPANIPEAVRAEAQRVALAAHRALGCEGYSRSDMVANDEGVWFLELNTLPGLTTSSLIPQQLHAAGMNMRGFLERQMALALRRHSAARRR
jgi:D-alanine-D-alanine ligase